MERIARVLATRHWSSIADGDDARASQEVMSHWFDYREDAIAILRTLREPDIVMADAGDADTWRAMVEATLAFAGGGGAHACNPHPISQPDDLCARRARGHRQNTAGCSPVVPTVDLRLALAWLVAVRPEEKGAIDQFWRDAMAVIPSNTNDHMKKYQRSTALKQRVAGMAEWLLLGQTALSNQMHRWLPIRLAPYPDFAEAAFVPHRPPCCSPEHSLCCGNFR